MGGCYRGVDVIYITLGCTKKVGGVKWRGAESAIAMEYNAKHATSDRSTGFLDHQSLRKIIHFFLNVIGLFFPFDFCGKAGWGPNLRNSLKRILVFPAYTYSFKNTKCVFSN